MERGEFKGTIETVSKRARTDTVGMAATEIYTMVSERMIVRLLKKITEQAERGERWASILAYAPDGSTRQVEELYSAVTSTSHFMQSEGFQTDEAQNVVCGIRYHQLTVFWGDGKSIYEHEFHRLGSMDPALFQDSIVT